MSVRIQSGLWKRTVLSVPEISGLRPSPAKIRETLVNWLRPLQPIPTVLDIFAGSGVLGLEVASQAPDNIHVSFVETNIRLVTNLQSSIERLRYQHAEVIRQDAFAFIRETSARYQLVLADPPYQLKQYDQIAIALHHADIVAPDGLIYLEYHPRHKPVIPGDWQQIRATRAGHVHAGLWQVRNVSTMPYNG